MAATETALIRVTELPALVPVDGAKLDLFRSWITEATALQSLQVVDDQSSSAAVNAKHLADDRIAEIKDEFKGPASIAYNIHRALTGEQKRLCDPWQGVIDAANSQVAAYKRKLEAEAAELARKQQQEEEERRRREAEEAAAFAPWEAVQPEVEEAIVRIPLVMPPPVTLSGVSSRSEWEIGYDLEMYVLAAAERLRRGDRTMLEYLLFDEKAIKAKVRKAGQSISDILPGIVARRKQESRIR